MPEPELVTTWQQTLQSIVGKRCAEADGELSTYVVQKPEV